MQLSVSPEGESTWKPGTTEGRVGATELFNDKVFGIDMWKNGMGEKTPHRNVSPDLWESWMAYDAEGGFDFAIN